MSKFKVWVDQQNIASGHIYTGTELQNNSQAQLGFQAGSPASSSLVNTMLRQNSLISVAVMNALGLNDQELDATSTVDEVQAAISGSSLFNVLKSILAEQDAGNWNIVPVQTDSVNLGSSSKKFNVIYSNTAYVESIDSTNIDATTVTASDKFIGDLEGHVNGNVHGLLFGTLYGTAEQAQKLKPNVLIRSIEDSDGKWRIRLNDQNFVSGIYAVIAKVRFKSSSYEYTERTVTLSMYVQNDSNEYASASVSHTYYVNGYKHQRGYCRTITKDNIKCIEWYSYDGDASEYMDGFVSGMYLLAEI